MGFNLRDFTAERNFVHGLTLGGMDSVISQEDIDAVLEQTGRTTKRVRKLSASATVHLVIAMSLFAQDSIAEVYQRLAQGKRLAWPDPTLVLPGASALAARRAQLGPRPLAALMRRIARVLATPATPGAFVYGRRIMAIDGSRDCVPDTPANRRAFGKPQSRRGEGAYPQVHGVYLVECGTHAIVDFGVWPGPANERAGALRLLRSVHADMLVLLDAGFYGFELFEAVLTRGADVLIRVPSYVTPRLVRRLADGTALMAIAAPKGPERELLVRVITYTVPDPKTPGARKTCRLMTSLLDPTQFEALDVVCLYHERWEIELVFDELGTHQRLAGGVLRSLTPNGVLQELYGLVVGHFAIRFLMHEASVAAQVDPRRLSFLGALRIVRRAAVDFTVVEERAIRVLYARLLGDIARAKLPPRRHRSNPRVIRRAQSKFSRKRPHHVGLPPDAPPFRDTVCLI